MQKSETNLRIGYEAKRIFHNKTGLGNYSRDLIRIISQYFPENNYFLYNPKESKNKLFEVNNSNVFEKQPITFFYKKFSNLWRQKGVINDLVNNKIQLFHGLSGELPSGLKKVRIKSVVTIHDLIFMRYPQFYSFFDRKIHFYKFKKATKSADLIIAISEQTKADIVNFLSIDPKKIKVVYQGCQEVFKRQFTPEEQEIVAKKFNLPKQFVLNVGTIEARKNVLAAVKAIKNCNTQLVIIGGDTSYSKKVRAYISKNKIEDKVLFLKGLDSKELAIVYQLATVFIYPSIFEGFGIPILEALYSKTPVITTNSGVFPEAGGPDSIYIDPTDSFEIQTKIELLLSDQQLRKSMEEKGFAYVQKFNDESIAKQIIEEYKKLLH